MDHPIVWLNDAPSLFPKQEYAFDEPNGLLAAGGDLTPARLLNAYSLGIFPWYNEGDPILWWTPSPRCVVFPSEFKPSKSLRKVINKQAMRVTLDRCFTDVMTACSEPRLDEPGTWINQDMIKSYTELHRLGYAHSVECWLDGHLVGGLYGIAIGRVFFGESMFSRVSNASKIAFAALCDQLTKWDFKVIDCQVHNPHLESLGACEISRDEFLGLLKTGRALPIIEEWSFG
jgi:leucyl/phenylalanyl-tRNA--protein transferase